MTVTKKGEFIDILKAILYIVCTGIGKILHRTWRSDTPIISVVEFLQL